MNLELSSDSSEDSRKLSGLVSKGGYSDDTLPFFTRNLFIADIKTEGPLTMQNMISAADLFIRKLPEPYSRYLSEKYKTLNANHNYRLLEPEEGREQLYELLFRGKYMGQSGYFSMIPENFNKFQKSFFKYFGEEYFTVIVFRLFDIAYSDINLLLIKNNKAAFFTFFSSD